MKTLHPSCCVKECTAKFLELKSLPPKIENLLKEFEDIFPKEGPIGLPPFRGIEHQIDLVLGASLPNRPSYRTNPQETKEIESQVQELLGKGWVQKSLSPCVFNWGEKQESTFQQLKEKLTYAPILALPNF